MDGGYGLEPRLGRDESRDDDLYSYKRVTKSTDVDKMRMAQSV